MVLQMHFSLFAQKESGHLSNEFHPMILNLSDGHAFPKGKFARGVKNRGVSSSRVAQRCQSFAFIQHQPRELQLDFNMNAC